jgi:hypothetical protein
VILDNRECSGRSHTMMRFVSTVMICGAALVACDSRSKSQGQTQAASRITAITACPDGAVVSGAAPPEGLRQRCQKSEGLRHGASREWYEDKTERSYSEWWDGNKHGRFMLWFKNGKVHSEGAHRHGAPAGHWKYYNEDGSLRQEQKFSIEPPPLDWLAQALAGHPPADEPPAPADGSAQAARAAAPEDDH